MTKSETGPAVDVECFSEASPPEYTGQRVAGVTMDRHAPDLSMPSAPRVTDNFPDFIPISTKELAAIEMFLGGMIDALVKPQR